MSLHEKLVSTVIHAGFYQEFFNFCIFNIGLHCTVTANIHDHKCIVTMLNLNGKPFYCKCYCATLIFNHLDIKYPEIIHLSEIPWCFLYMYIKILCMRQQEILSLFNINLIFNKNSDLYRCTKHTYTSRYAAD